MKKIISLFLICVCLSSVLWTTGCKEKFSQEEFRVEYIEKLIRMGVKKNTTADLPDTVLLHCDVIADDLTILSGKLELYIHCYEIYEPDCEKITYDEIVGLYSVYDEEIYYKFNEFYKWLCTGNGRAYVEFYCEAMITANKLYKEKYGEFFSLKRVIRIGHWNKESALRSLFAIILTLCQKRNIQKSCQTFV